MRLGVRGWGGAASGSQSRQGRQQVAGIDGFDDVRVRTGLDRFGAVGFEIAPGGDDQRRLLPLGIAADASTDLEPIAARHEQVNEHRVRPMALHHLETLVTVARLQNRPTVRLQALGGSQAKHWVVVDN